jgi:hypothetical protein
MDTSDLTAQAARNKALNESRNKALNESKHLQTCLTFRNEAGAHPHHGSISYNLFGLHLFTFFMAMQLHCLRL